MNVDTKADSFTEVLLTLSVPDAPAVGFTVTGSGFPPDSWIWITVEDITTGTQPVDGPDAFQPGPDGSFTRTGPTVLTCGHTVRANAFVQDVVVATSAAVTPRCAPPTGTTADVNATAATKAVHTDLMAAPERVDHRLVVGQALRGDDFDWPVSQPITALTDMGLPAPMFVEVDLTTFGVTPEHDTELFTLLRSHAAQGGLIGFSFHVNTPFNDSGSDHDRNDVDLPRLFDPDNPLTEAGRRWRAQLDRAAEVLQHFADVDAVVLFRPLHESNLEYFWWGAWAPEDFQALWRGMFRYLTTTKDLHNLLWVYSAARNSGGALSDPLRLYPGADLVDLVGLDIYDDNLSDAEPGESGYAAMLTLNKPFGITEYGAADWPEPHDGAVHLPNDRVIKLIKDRYPHTVLATAWYSRPFGGNGNRWQISDKPNPQALLRDAWAITLQRRRGSR